MRNVRCRCIAPLALAVSVGVGVAAASPAVAGPSLPSSSSATQKVSAFDQAQVTQADEQAILAESEQMLAIVESVPDSVIAQGDLAVTEYLTEAGLAPNEVAALGFWDVVKCAAAITVAIGSTIFAAAKLAKIKKLIKAAGGVRATAKRVVAAFKAKGSLSQKAKEAFGDLGSGAVAAAVLILDIDAIKANCS